MFYIRLSGSRGSRGVKTQKYRLAMTDNGYHLYCDELAALPAIYIGEDHAYNTLEITNKAGHVFERLDFDTFKAEMIKQLYGDEQDEERINGIPNRKGW